MKGERSALYIATENALEKLLNQPVNREIGESEYKVCSYLNAFLLLLRRERRLNPLSSDFRATELEDRVALRDALNTIVDELTF